MGDEDSTRVDRVRVSGRPDPGPLDDVTDGAEVDVGDDDAPSRRILRDRDFHVGLGAPLEADRSEVLLVGACADERGRR